MRLINSILLAFSSLDETPYWGQYGIYLTPLSCATVFFYHKTHCILIMRSISTDRLQTAGEHIFGEPERMHLGDSHLERVETGQSFHSAQI